ncbi:hypothetical protein [Curtobacterium sp. MCSS17_006]|uniref:hypothetical protein n=1 Tax=Curtobacterium sp. MCSS17_006 TaxID=2175642 RepID=UPI0015E8C750|nr:hypothetical protein [Curtobacterium sp. MCSS17_006]
MAEPTCNDFVEQAHGLNPGVWNALDSEDNLSTAIHDDHPCDRVSAEVGSIDISDSG